jgi:hypothetical protein
MGLHFEIALANFRKGREVLEVDFESEDLFNDRDDFKDVVIRWFVAVQRCQREDDDFQALVEMDAPTELVLVEDEVFGNVLGA